MPLARVRSGALVGIEGIPLDVEVDLGSTVPGFFVVGLPDAAVQEARDRVRAAVRNAGFTFPLRRITANLAPADVRKEGPIYDLPIAVALLVASGQVLTNLEDTALFGELSLDGHLRHANGVLPLVAMCAQAGISRVIVPAEDVREARLIEGIEVLGLESLSQLREDPPVWSDAVDSPVAVEAAVVNDLSVVQGQEHVKRALEVACAGGHNLMMQGPPGAGKTLLARTIPGLLPPLAPSEALEVTKVHSVAGMLGRARPLLSERPFRAPHHTISHAGLVGGGSHIRPGEVSLAHRGVLFLDEFPEFAQTALEALREPLESGAVTISRARGSATFPARFLLVAAMNPCPCGYHGDTKRSCTCAEATVTRYQRRVSGPLLDRFDLFVDVQRVEYDDLAAAPSGDSSETVRERVATARELQSRRLAGTPYTTNAEMGPLEVREHCQAHLAPGAQPLLAAAMQQLALSARAFHRILKVARTIADLALSDIIEPAHLAEAIQYRRRGVE
jgi:magnesium chelatase family protein